MGHRQTDARPQRCSRTQQRSGPLDLVVPEHTTLGRRVEERMEERRRTEERRVEERRRTEERMEERRVEEDGGGGWRRGRWRRRG